MTPSETWLEAHPGRTLNDYVQAMQGGGVKAKRRRFDEAMHPDRPRGYFRWAKTRGNGFMLAVWGALAGIPLFGVACLLFDEWRKR